MKKFWFSGLAYSLPIGSLLAFIYAKSVTSIRSLFRFNSSAVDIPLTDTDHKIMVLLIISCVVLFFLSNVKRRYVNREQDFSPLKRLQLTDNSADKNRAMYHPVPKKYLSKEPDGFTVGKYGSRFVRLPFHSSPEHQLILGSPGSNKSTSLLNALIWNYNYEDSDKGLRSVLAIDAKPELSSKSVDESRSDVRIINPASFDSWGFDVWYDLSPASSDDEIKERAEAISRALIPTLSGDNAHFSGNAQKLLSGFLMYGFRKGMSFTDSIVNVMQIAPQDYIAEIITDPNMQDHPKIIGKVKAFDGNTSDEFASIVDTLEKDLSIFDTESVKHCFSDNKKKVVPQNLLDGISVYLAIPDHLLSQYKTVFGMIMELCLKHLMSVPEYALQNARPVWCLVDEGGTIYVPSLLDVASRGRSKKIQLSLVAQSFSQLEDLYGGYQARSILDCCKTTIVFSCNDTRTAKDLSAWTGTYRETKVSTHSNAINPLAIPESHNTSIEYRPSMDVSDIKCLERDFKVLVFARGDWFVCDKAPYYTIPELKVISDGLYKRNVGQLLPKSKPYTMKYTDFLRNK